MFDTMTSTKIIGGLCGTLLIFLFGNWAAESLYHVGATGHGDGEVVQGYLIETGDEGGAAEETVEVDFAEVYASADAAKGERVFSKCKACHKLEDGANGTGPYLFNVVNRDIAAVDGFGYSDALASLDGAWTPEHLDGFLASPKSYAPGTKMTFSGLPKVEDRADLIAYLATFGG